MRVGALNGFAYLLVKLVLLANSNGYEVDSNTFFFFSVVKPSIHLQYCLVQTLTFVFFDTHSYL